MPCANSIEEAIALAEQRWPGYEFKIKNSEEACGSCPICHAAETDGFLIFASGYYWDRKGGCSGWLDDDKEQIWTPEELRLRRIEAQQAHQARKQTELERRISALERIATCTDHRRYHADLLEDPAAVEWALAQGLEFPAIIDSQIGKCTSCRTDHPDHRPSYTLPIWRKDAKTTDGPLWSIRHRLVNADNGNKYRPHIAGLGRQLVNARKLADWNELVIVLEGCKKTRVVEQYVPNVVGILGKSGFDVDRWLGWFHPAARIVLMLDPDAYEASLKLGKEISKTGKRVYVAKPPMKPDDMFVAGCTTSEWLAYVNLARKAH